MEERMTDHSTQVNGDWLLIRHVPTGTCTRCGEQIFRADVLQRLEEIVHGKNQQSPEASIQMPVFAF
jgi:YgiT-type zinc finger domain-containing protein